MNLAHRPHPTTEPLLHGTDDAANLLSIGRSALYELIASGALRSVKIGRRRLIPADALAEYVASLSGEAA